MLACATGVFASTLREFSEKNPNAVHNIEFTEDVTPSDAIEPQTSGI